MRCFQGGPRTTKTQSFLRSSPSRNRNPPEFIKRFTDSGTASEEDLEETDLLTIHPPDKEEIRKNIKKLKNKKTSTDMPAEFLKAAMESESYITALESLYRETWVDVVIPELWRKTTITPLYKGLALEAHFLS